MTRLIVLFALLFTTLVAKQETFPFIGVSISTQTVDLENRANRPNIDEDASFSLRYGKQTTDLRTIFAINGNGTFQTFSVEVDKILMDDMFGYPQVRPYIGGVIGYMHYDGDTIPRKSDDNSTDDTESEDEIIDLDAPFLESNDGYFYGANLGFIIYAGDNLDLDISYHYYKVEEIEPIDSMQGFTFGINYFY